MASVPAGVERWLMRLGNFGVGRAVGVGCLNVFFVAYLGG